MSDRDNPTQVKWHLCRCHALIVSQVAKFKIIYILVGNNVNDLNNQHCAIMLSLSIMSEKCYIVSLVEHRFSNTINPSLPKANLQY